MNSLTFAAQERIRAYDDFKRKIDALNKWEAACEEFRAVLMSRGHTNYWMSVTHWGFLPFFKIELRKDEKLSDIGWLIEPFERIFGEITRTEDETESWTARRFDARHARLMVEIPSGSVTCRRVETGEVETKPKYKLECVEGAQ